MVLIIGLINLTGPQAAQAQQAADVAEEDAQLTSLTLTYNDGASNINILSPAFEPSHGSYTATVDYSVNSVSVTAVPADNEGYTANAAGSGKNTTASGSAEGGKSITTTNQGVTTITVTVTEDATPPEGQEKKTATYVITLTKTAPDIPDGGPRLTALTLASNPPVDNPGSIGLKRMDGGAVPDNFSNIAGVNTFKASVPFRVQSVLVGHGDLSGNAAVDAVTITPRKQNFDSTHVQSNDSEGAHRVKLSVGMTTIRLTATKLGGTAVYTVYVTRELPVLDGIGLNVGDANYLPASSPPTGGQAFASAQNSYKVTLPFTASAVTLGRTLDGDHNGRQTTEILPVDEDAGTQDVHELNFDPGQTRRITVQVWEDQTDQYNPPDNDQTTVNEAERRTSSSTRTYTH